MKIRNRDINLFTGFGRKYFELELAQKPSGSRVFPTRQDICVKVVNAETDAGAIFEYSITEDLFAKERFLFFPDLEQVNNEIRKTVSDLHGEKERLKATVLIPVKDPSKAKKTLPEGVEIIYIGEEKSSRIARGYARWLFLESEIEVEEDTLDLLTLNIDEEPRAFMGEIEKIWLSVKGKGTLNEETVLDISRARPGMEVFDILREVIRGDLKKGLKDLYFFTSHVDDGEILRVLGALNWSLKKELSGAKRKEKRSSLIELISLAGRIDADIKGGSRLTSREILLNSLLEFGKVLEKARG